MLTVFAVMMEGHVPFFDTDRALNGKPYITASSYWLTLEEAQFAIDRKFAANFGSWTPKRRWVEKVSIPVGKRDMISSLAHGAPEYATHVLDS